MKTSYDIFGQIEPSKIYLARPGHRLLGALDGIDESSARLEINLNNTSVLEFTIQRILDGEINPYYDLVSQHYELYVTNFGWFKINEQPTLQGNGNTESKSVRAESGEIELQQYDLVGFEINTGSEASWEMMAPDNTYEVEGFKLPYDNIKFYRDTTNLQELSETFAEDEGSTVQDLQAYLYAYPEILSSPRIDFVYDTVDDAIRSTIDDYRAEGKSTTVLEGLIGKTELQPEKTRKQFVLNMLNVYKEMRNYIQITVDQSKDDDANYSIQEVIDRELERQNRLSFLWLVLHEHGWKVGYVDPYVDPEGATEADRERLADRVGKFEVDSQDIYSFLTQNAAQYYRCMFVFDTENYLVNAYKIENVGFDTNIYLSFHSIQNSVTRNSDKQLYTVFHVAGADDLDPTEANYGLNTIEDLSYFMTTDHFSQEVIDKYNIWKDHYETRRQEYMNLSIDYRKLTTERDEIYDRVPLDAANTAQYHSFSNEELIEEEAKLRSYMAGYEATYVDENNEFDIDLMREESPRDYSHYIMIRDQIIPNVQIELYNRGLQSDEDNRDFLDGYIYDFDTYGQSYGLAELKVQMQKLNNSIRTLKEKHYNKTPEDEDSYAMEQYQMYLKYTQAYSEAETACAERQQEYDEVQSRIADVISRQLEMKEDVDISNPQFNFTPKELWLLDKYRIHTDYVNDNILTTSITDESGWVNTEYDLIKDAYEQLYAESHPQYNFETTQDNLLLIPEFKDWHGDLDVGNFIRVAMREDYQVKLRVTTIGVNPFMTEPTIDIQFSNMVQYASSRDDFVSLMENGRSSSKNQITSRIGASSSKQTVEVDSNLIMKILNNGMFSAYMSNQGSIISGDAINATSGSIAGIVAQQIDAVEINVNKIVGEEADFERLFANYIDSDYIVTNILRAEQADIQELTTEILRVGHDGITQITNDTIQTANIQADHIVGTTAQFDTLSSNIITGDRIVAGLASVDDPEDYSLLADSAFIDYLNSGVIEAATVTADNIIAGLAGVTEEQKAKFNILADTAFMNYLETNLVVASEIKVDDLRAKLATIDVADVTQLAADSAFIQGLQSISSTSAQSVINQAYVMNLVAGNISVADLATHSATADEIVLISQDGNPSIAFKGSTQQFYDSDGNVRVQIGQDGTGDFNFVVTGADGTTALFDYNGITRDGIPANTIVNNMINDGTIQKSKLGFPIVDTNDDGTINITSIKDGSGGSFGVEYTTFKQNTSDAIDDINSKKMYRVEITSSNGNYFKNGEISTTLSCHVYSWDDEITNELNASVFKWTKINNDGTPDSTWNSAHFGGAKSITITASDVYVRGTFNCAVTLPDGETISSGD